MKHWFFNLFMYEKSVLMDYSSVDTTFLNCLYKGVRYDEITIFHNLLYHNTSFYMRLYNKETKTTEEVKLSINTFTNKESEDTKHKT